MLGDRNQQWLPVQHCPGRSARWPRFPLPEVHGERDTLGAVWGGAADFVPVSITQESTLSAKSWRVIRSELQLLGGQD